MKFGASFLFVVLAIAALVESKSYKNHRVVSLFIENEQQLQGIRNLQALSGVRLKEFNKLMYCSYFLATP